MGDLPGLVSHKLYIFLYVLNILDILLGRVGIIESQVTVATLVDLRLHEIKTHGLAVTDVQVSVGLGRETSQNDVAEFGDSLLDQLLGV
jgi:hypothetical protein